MISKGVHEELERTIGLRLADDRQTELAWREFAERYAERRIRRCVANMVREVLHQALFILGLALASACIGIALYFRFTHWPTH